MIKFSKISFFFFLVLILSCGIQIKDGDLDRAGFLNDNCIQLLLKFSPAEGASGLVNSRNSAYQNYRQQLYDNALEQLSELYFNEKLKNEKKISSIELKKNLEEQLTPIIKKGHVAAEYYDEDHSLVVVYRIKRTDIKKIIESIDLTEK